MAGFDVGAMEYFGAQPHAPIETCLRELQKADVVVLIVGPRYGSLLPQGISYTHAEFREAKERGIPVLAFRIPDASDIAESERNNLSNFSAELGSANTFVPLSPSESHAALSGKVLASLRSAQDRGDLGSRYSIFQRAEEFFARQLKGTSTFFNHLSPLHGRESELQQILRFFESDDPLLIVKGPGGCGKSRLLLEAARTASSRPELPEVRFADAGAQWGKEDIDRLPTIPLIIAIDDAHRRADLDRLMDACLRHNQQARFLVSCRPSAVDVVKSSVATLAFGTALPELAIAPLPKSDSEALARECLPKDFGGLAARLVSVADRNPLVIVVGAKCIAEKRVLPDELERSPAVFKSIVLDHLLKDPCLDGPDGKMRKDLLSVLAAIGPIPSDSGEVVTCLAASIDAATYHTRSALASLEKSGFLIRRGRLVRVSPDVIADHLLFKAAVDENGISTGFVDSMIERFSQYFLENILANAAELDWRSANAGSYQPVLSQYWDGLMDVLPEWSDADRAALLDKLRRAAVFAPSDVLRVVEWIANHATKSSKSDWQTQAVPRTLAEMYAFIAQHPDYTERCVPRLWEYAESDGSPTNSDPKHPRRLFESMLKYGRDQEWQSPESVHAKVVKHINTRLGRSTRKSDLSWAIELVGHALDRLGDSSTATRRQFTIRRYSLARSLRFIEERRKSIIETLRGLALQMNVSEASASVRLIATLVRRPDGPFGRMLESDEIEAWRPEAERAISILSEVANSSPLDCIRYLARRELRNAKPDRWSSIAPALTDAMLKTPPIALEPLFDLLIGFPWEEQLDHYEDEAKRVEGLCDTSAELLWRICDSADIAIRRIVDGLAELQPIAMQWDTHAGLLVQKLCEKEPQKATEIVESISRIGPLGWPLLRPALLSIYSTSPMQAIGLVEGFSQASDSLLRVYAVDAMRWMVEDEPSRAKVLAIATRMVNDPDTNVRQALTLVVYRIGNAHVVKTLPILLDIDWSGNAGVANSVLRALDPQHGVDPAMLSDDNIDTLLSRIKQLSDLENGSYEVIEFVGYASTRRPKQTLDMLLSRVLTDEHQRENDSGRGFTPLPYGSSNFALPGFSKYSNHLDLLRNVRDVYLNASDITRYWLPKLFGVASNEIKTGLVVLREWMVGGSQEMLIGVAALLGSWDHSIVFTEHHLISDLIQAASTHGSTCVEQVRSKLFGIAICGVISGTPGVPAPRHVSDKESAELLSRRYADIQQVREFYESLAQHAERCIQQDILDGEDLEDDE